MAETARIGTATGPGPDYCRAGDVVDIPKLAGKWQRQPDSVRYAYATARTACPVCGEAAAGVPWHGWFVCDYRDRCCVALVGTGEVFLPVGGAENVPG